MNYNDPAWRSNEQAQSEILAAVIPEEDFTPIVCERCRKGPHDDGFPPIYTTSEALQLGWTRNSQTGGLLDEECASEILSNDYDHRSA
jgi:hypothetical protein